MEKAKGFKEEWKKRHPTRYFSEEASSASFHPKGGVACGLLESILNHCINLWIIPAGMPYRDTADIIFIDNIHKGCEVDCVCEPDLVGNSIICIAEVGTILGILDDLNLVLLSETDGSIIGNTASIGPPIITIGGQTCFELGTRDDGYCIVQDLANPAGWSNRSGSVPAVVVEHETNDIDGTPDSRIIMTCTAARFISPCFCLNGDV